MPALSGPQLFTMSSETQMSPRALPSFILMTGFIKLKCLYTENTTRLYLVLLITDVGLSKGRIIHKCLKCRDGYDSYIYIVNVDGIRDL